jgi:hypothetical protein
MVLSERGNKLMTRNKIMEKKKMNRIDAGVLFDNKFDCYADCEIDDDTIAKQPAMTRDKFIELAESHISLVSGLWVSVKERLPEHLERIMFISKGVMYIGVLNRAGGLQEWHTPYSVMRDIQYWMPLPEKPIDA